MRLLPALLPVALLAGCIEPVTLSPSPAGGALRVGESRVVELRALRMEVADFEETLTLDDLQRLPRATLEELWLLDLELKPLVTNTLVQLLATPPDQLPSDAARNMQALLSLTPNDIDFSRTQLEELLALSGSIGVPPARAIADLLQIGRADNVIPVDVAAEVITTGLISSHPSGQVRHGPRTADNPDGLYPVTPGTLPVTLADVVDQFANLTEKFGPTALPDGTMHPGFIEEAKGFAVIEDEFAMVVKVNANALPYKGVDLTDASVASVNSIGSQIEKIFNTNDPTWLKVVGLVPEASIQTLTVRVNENPRFIASGTQREPLPLGNGEAWTLPAWEFERLVAEMTRLTTDLILPDCLSYTVGQNTEVFRACVDATGWTTFETFDNVGNPPEPSYLWDIQLNLAQVRLHDRGLAEGEANVAFTIHDVGVGIRSDEMVERIKANFAQNPSALRDLASASKESTVGAADFYYTRQRRGGPSDQDGDWLVFLEESDIPRTDSGRVRPYSYAKPGFFADEALTKQMAARTLVDGDDLHLKVRVAPGDVLFVQDDAGRVFRVAVVDKPSARKLRLDVRAVR